MLRYSWVPKNETGPICEKLPDKSNTFARETCNTVIFVYIGIFNPKLGVQFILIILHDKGNQNRKKISVKF
jgi:hypothetical protein